MMPKDYAYYNTTTGLIENVLYIEAEVAPTLVWPDGYAIVEIPGEEGLAGEWSMCGIGWSYINGQFVEPPMPQPAPETDQPTTSGAQTL